MLRHAYAAMPPVAWLIPCQYLLLRARCFATFCHDVMRCCRCFADLCYDELIRHIFNMLLIYADADLFCRLCFDAIID